MFVRERVLLTGNAGYIGSVLTGYLIENQYQVIGIDSLRFGNYASVLPFLSSPYYKFYNESVRDYRRVNFLAKDCDVIIPLAALVGAPICEKNSRLAEEINSEAIRNLVKNLSKNQRIFYPNTNSGYGQTDGDSEVTEEDVLSPVSVYGKTKCDGEKAVLEHPNSTVFRLATVFGISPRMRLDLMVNDFTYQLNKIKIFDGGRGFEIFEPHFKRNFVGINDVARAFLHMMRFACHQQVYNLGLPDANLSKWELAKKVCDVIGLTKDVLKIGNGTDPDKRNYIVSNKKILSKGFEFKQTLEEGIRDVQLVCDLLPAHENLKLRNI